MSSVTGSPERGKDANMATLTTSERGKMGWNKTTWAWFWGNDELHKNWLRVHAKAVYADMCRRPGIRGYKFPPRIMHPSKLSPVAFWYYQMVCVIGYPLQAIYGKIKDEEFDCIEAVLTGKLDPVRPGELPF